MPYFAECGYIREWRSAYDAPYVILVHSHHGVGWESTGIAHWAGGFGGGGGDDPPRFLTSFCPANAPIFACYYGPTTNPPLHTPILPHPPLTSTSPPSH